MSIPVSASSNISPNLIAATLTAYREHPYTDYIGRAAFYAEDAVCYDPVGLPPAVGRPAIEETFRRTVSAGISSKTEVTRQFIADDRAAVSFSGQVFRNGEPIRRLDGIVLFQFEEDLLIRRMEVFIDM